MKLLFIILIIPLMFSGCGDYVENCIEDKFIEYWNKISDLYHTDYNYKKIEDWQDRETECLGYPIHQDDENFMFDLNLVTKIRNRVVRRIESKPDTTNYWQTSCETEIRGKGDCEDTAIMIWKELRDAGFPDDIIGMVKIKWYPGDDKQFHVFAIVNLQDGDFYILDNGALHKYGVMSEDVQRASDVLNKSIELIVGFNLFSIWDNFPTFDRWVLNKGRRKR